MFARITFSSPLPRANEVGGESEPDELLYVDCARKKARLFFRKVTQFVPGAPSAAYSTQSISIEIDLGDAALSNLLTQFVSAAKAQGKIPSDATVTIVP